MKLIELYESDNDELYSIRKDIHTYYWDLTSTERESLKDMAANIKQTINTLDEQTQLKILNFNPPAFEYIKNPSDLVIKYALYRHGENIARLYKKKIPVTHEYIKIALGNDIRAMKHIKNPSESLMVQVVSQRPKALQFIISAKKKFKDDTPLPVSVISAATKKNPGAGLRILIANKLITKKDAQSLFPRTIDAFRYLDNPTEEQQIIFASRSVDSIRALIGMGITPSAKVIEAAMTKADKHGWRLESFMHYFRDKVLPLTPDIVTHLLQTKVLLTNPIVYKQFLDIAYPNNELMHRKWLRYLENHVK